MLRLRLFKLLNYFLLILVGRLGFAQSAATAIIKQNPERPNPYLSQIFTEKVLSVSREADGILPGTLRSALIQASGIRAQNSFALVKIVFEPHVKRARVTKGPLPELDGSLTTLDCQIPTGRVLIEGVDSDTAGLDPSEEMAGLKITSNGNTIRNCHLTGFSGPGILLRGNRNLVEYNTIGYHKEVPEAQVEPSALYDEPKTNKGSGITLDEGAHENLIQNNEIVANTYNGVLFTQRAGAHNKVVANYFTKNSGKPIQILNNQYTTARPQITKIIQQGDLYIFSGSIEPRSEVQLYLMGKDDSEVGLLLFSGQTIMQDRFTVATKNKGFVNSSKVVAIAHGLDRNSSEFSTPILVVSKPVITPAVPDAIVSKPTPVEDSGHVEEKLEESEAVEDTSEPDPDREAPPRKSVVKEAPPKAESSITPAQVETKAAEPATTININGLGEKGSEPDSGNPRKARQTSSFGI